MSYLFYLPTSLRTLSSGETVRRNLKPVLWWHQTLYVDDSQDLEILITNTKIIISRLLPRIRYNYRSEAYKQQWILEHTSRKYIYLMSGLGCIKGHLCLEIKLIYIIQHDQGKPSKGCF